MTRLWRTIRTKNVRIGGSRIVFRGDLVDNGWKRRALAAEARVRALEQAADQFLDLDYGYLAGDGTQPVDALAEAMRRPRHPEPDEEVASA